MKCGDIVRNHWAGDMNPQRVFLFLRNEGKYSRVVAWDGKHLDFCKFYTADMKTDKFEAIGHIPITQIIKDALMRHMEVPHADGR